MPNDRYGTVGTGLGAGTGAGTVQVRYGYGTWVRKPYPCTVPMYRTDRTHVPYRPYPCIVPVQHPYRTCTVPAPVPAPKPVPTVPYLSKPLSKTPSAPYGINPIKNMVFISLEIS